MHRSPAAMTREYCRRSGSWRSQFTPSSGLVHPRSGDVAPLAGGRRAPRAVQLATCGQAQRGQMILTELASWPNEVQFLHGDFIPDNVLISEAGLRAGFG